MSESQQEQADTQQSDQQAQEAAAEQQAREDDQWRAEHPNEVLGREANPNVGGESFGGA